MVPFLLFKANKLVCKEKVDEWHKIWYKIWCSTSSVQQSNTHKCHYQLVAQRLYLLCNASTCFGLTFWPSSGSYKFDRRVQLIWQVVIDDWQPTYIYNIIIQWLYCYIIYVHVTNVGSADKNEGVTATEYLLWLQRNFLKCCSVYWKREWKCWICDENLMQN
jgi:hypothetical protein